MPKTHKNLYPQIYDFGNLLLAHQKARRGKRKTDEMRAFHFDLEEELWQLHDELRDGNYRPGPYRNFYIYEPKTRKVSAAPFRDRVVHHALCNVIEPLFERKFIYDSYACRKGKGQHRALDRAQRWVRRYPLVLKADIRQFFPSVDHDLLLGVLRRTIACRRTLDLCARILESGAGILDDVYELRWFPGDTLFTPLERARGLPIGNLTSQFWGNVLLNELDHFAKETLRRPAYLRYVDDFLVFGESKGELWEVRDAVAGHLAQLRLILHPHKQQIWPTAQGVDFLGFRLFPYQRRLRQENLRRARRRFRRLRAQLTRGQISQERVRRSITSWVGHAAHGDTYRLRRDMLSSLVW